MSEVFDLILSELRKVVPYRSASVQRLDGDEWVIDRGYGYPDVDELVGHRYRVSGPSDPPGTGRAARTVILSDPAARFPQFEDVHVEGTPSGQGWRQFRADRRSPDRDADVRLVRG